MYLFLIVCIIYGFEPRSNSDHLLVPKPLQNVSMALLSLFHKSPLEMSCVPPQSAPRFPLFQFAFTRYFFFTLIHYCFSSQSSPGSCRSFLISSQNFCIIWNGFTFYPRGTPALPALSSPLPVKQKPSKPNGVEIIAWSVVHAIKVTLPFQWDYIIQDCKFLDPNSPLLHQHKFTEENFVVLV